MKKLAAPAKYTLAKTTVARFAKAQQVTGNQGPTSVLTSSFF